MTVTVTLDLPLHGEHEHPEALARRLTLLWVLDEVRQGRMTRRRAASALGTNFDDFLREASEHGIDTIDYDLDDFRQELGDAP